MDNNEFEKPIPVYDSIDEVKPIQYFSWNQDGSLTLVSDNGSIIYTNSDTYMVDKYGNTLSINDIQCLFKLNSPTYEALHEHWLKTKDK